MIIVAALYIGVVWLVFFRFKLLPWTWPWWIGTAVLGACILAVFVGLLNTLAPSGRVVVVGRVIEITPNVAGTVTAIPVEPNTLVKAGTILFQIDPAPYEAKIKQLSAAITEARQKVEQLKAGVEIATAEVTGLASQVVHATKRRDDIERLARANTTSGFKLQDTVAQFNTLSAQLQAAKAREMNAKLALGSEIGGENTAVAQLIAQLENARWELDQTTIRASADGYVSTMALAVGARAVTMRSALAFILAGDMQIVGVFPQNGFKSVQRGASVRMVFANRPGEIYSSVVSEVPRGIGQGQIAVSGTLARPETIGTSTSYPVRIDIPDGLDRDMVRLGMVGSATVISDKAGPIGIVAKIILWVTAYVLYL